MKSSNQKFADKDIEIMMGNLLRFGVLLSAVIVLTGAVIYIWKHGGESMYYTTFSGEPKRLTEIGSIWQTAMKGSGRAIIQLGLLVLIATPIARILFSIVGFIIEKDILYTLITLFVLAVIIFSFF
jgi:uncharacterized membrane protein